MGTNGRVKIELSVDFRSLSQPGESDDVEFKSTLRTEPGHTGQADRRNSSRSCLGRSRDYLRFAKGAGGASDSSRPADNGEALEVDLDDFAKRGRRDCDCIL